MQKDNLWDSTSQAERAKLLLKWGEEDGITYGPSNARKRSKEINNKKLQVRIASYNNSK